MTLIELVMVIVVLGIIAAVAVPRFVDLKSGALTEAVKGSKGAFESAYTIASAQARGLPTMAQIDGVLDGLALNVPAAPTGFIQDLDGDAVTDLTVNTFTDAACTVPTSTPSGATGTVACYTYTP